MCEYERTRRITYGGFPEDEGAVMVFIPVCEQCSRFVKADPKVCWNEDTGVCKPNATCKRCGRVGMIFEGWFSPDELE